MRIYQSYDEIEKELKLLDLQKKVAYEELVGVKRDLEEYTKPITWVSSLFKLGSKYGLLLLVKKMFK
jgi:hypothetical protein